MSSNNLAELAAVMAFWLLNASLEGYLSALLDNLHQWTGC
jgi:hypothetical protein